MEKSCCDLLCVWGRRTPGLLALAFALPLLWGADAISAAEMPDVVHFCPGARPVGHLPKNAVLDSTWRRIAPAFGVCRIVNRKNTWGAQCAWIRSTSIPDRTYTLDELLSLDDRGLIPADMRFVAVNYKWVVRGESEEDAKRHATDDFRRGVPVAVAKALDEQLAKYAKDPARP